MPAWRSPPPAPEHRSTRTMASPVDPNDVLMTGENSFIRLSRDGGKTLADRASHWRGLWGAAGSGPAPFLKSELTDGKARGDSDNPAAGRRPPQRNGGPPVPRV